MRQIMKKLIYTFLIISTISNADFKNSELLEDLTNILNDLSSNYIYVNDKNIDLSCLKKKYSKKLQSIKTDEQKVLVFEYLLDEFYDSHVHLNFNLNSSYRLYAPIYATIEKNKALITNVWQTQILDVPKKILGAEILKINNIPIHQAIDTFPTVCQDKSNTVIREWLLNKVLAGRYSEPRVLTLKLKTGNELELDLDSIEIRKDKKVLSSRVQHNIGIIRVNNSLGTKKLSRKFKRELHKLAKTDGLIIDLRNTVDGGDSVVAKPIMANFVKTKQPYQKHENKTESWVEFVNPSNKQYEKPVIILVGRWTGSMGEGLAIGFEGINRGIVVGTLMERLAGAMNSYKFENSNFGYSLSTEKLYHINGTPREEYIPTVLVKQTSLNSDETLEKAFQILFEK